MMSAADETADSPAFGASRVGAELRAARQRLGWTLPDVAATLRIRLPYLEAIEEGRLSDLPGNAYAMGFLRSYAMLLGLDAAEVARRFRAEAHEVNRKPVLAFPAPVPERGVPAGAVVLLGVLLAAGAYAGWYRFSGDTPGAAPVVPAVPERLAPLADRAAPPSNPSPQVASILPGPASAGAAPLIVPPPAVVAPPPPVVAPVVAAAPPPPPPNAPRMVLRLKSDAWVHVEGRQGQVLVNGMMRAGQAWPVPTGQPLLLTTSNAAGTEVVVDGVASPVPGGAGTLKQNFPLNPDALKPLVTPRVAAPRTAR